MRISVRESLIYSEPFNAFFRVLSKDITKNIPFPLLDQKYSELLSKCLVINLAVARGILLWLFHMKRGKTKTEYINDLPLLFRIVVAYAKMVNGQVIEKTELRYISGMSQSIESVTTNLLNNIKWMIEHFGLQFFARKYCYVIFFPDNSYFLELRGGMYESNFGVEVILGKAKTDTFSDGGIFARIGFDTMGKSLRIVRIGGVKGKAHIINDEFPRDMGINPFKLLLLLVIQFAYQNGFTEISGIKERFHPHNKLRAGDMSYTRYYRSLGMRKHREVEHYRSIDGDEAYDYFRWRVKSSESRTVQLFTSAWNEMEPLENRYRITEEDYPLPNGRFLKIETRNRLVL